VKNITFSSLLIVFLLFSVLQTTGQVGGNNTFEFLNLPASARIAALGDNYAASKDGDITLSLTNPSLINPDINNNLSLSFIDYFSDINYGFAMYGNTFNKVGSFVGTVQFIDYGTFTYADETGQPSGTFGASEYALNIGWGRELDSSFSIGANFKTIFSSLESYQSWGLGVDVAGSYHHAKSQLTLSLIARNIGMQLSTYYGSERAPLPFELGFGLSKRLKHLPFRYFINYNNIQKWDLTYVDPNDPDQYDPFTGEPKSQSGIADFADKFMRHIVVGGELVIAKVIALRLGYNYQRRQELKLNDKAGMVGFSWGVGLDIKRFNISYGRSTYHLAGSPNYFTLTTDLNELFGKKR
jgi:hypothetical protein